MEKIYKALSTTAYFGIFNKMEANYLAKRYLEHNIQYGQYQYLIALFLKNGQNHDELTKFLNTDKVSTTRAIEKLRENDYVSIEIDENDKRFKKVFITKKAKNLKNTINQIYTDWQDELFNCLDEEEIKELDRICKKIFESKK